MGCWLYVCHDINTQCKYFNNPSNSDRIKIRFYFVVTISSWGRDDFVTYFSKSIVNVHYEILIILKNHVDIIKMRGKRQYSNDLRDNILHVYNFK